MSALALASLRELSQHPVRTKSATSGTFNALSEVLAAMITGEKDPQTGTFIGPRAIKMALYGALVTGPLAHYLVDFVQRTFRRMKPSKLTNIAQIVALNIIVNPVMAVTFIAWMNVLSGVRSFAEIKKRVRASLFSVLKSQWITSPLLIAFAQKFVPQIAWTPMFSFFAFLMGTYHNVLVRKRLAAQKKEDEKKLD